MKLYIDATGKYVATQEEAKAAGKGWHQVDVPTSEGRQGLADYLNALRWSEERLTREEIINSNSPEAQTAAKALMNPVSPINASASSARATDDIVAFILDEAAVHQCENIFGALGTRFAELAKSSR